MKFKSIVLYTLLKVQNKNVEFSKLQVRISSAEAQHKDKLESSQGDGTNLHQDVASDLDHIERKLSGGFFSKRFGITKMKAMVVFFFSSDVVKLV